MTSGVVVESLSFTHDPPTFTLLAHSSGGPPATSVWTRNGVPITNSNSSFAIRLTSQCPQLNEACLNSEYESRLIVTGNLPGEYQYIVGNRARSTNSTSSIDFEG